MIKTAKQKATITRLARRMGGTPKAEREAEDLLDQFSALVARKLDTVAAALEIQSENRHNVFSGAPRKKGHSPG